MIRFIDRLVGALAGGGSDRTDGFLAGAVIWTILAGFIGTVPSLAIALVVNLIVWREETRGRS